ncbi:MAG: hypothetical protein K2X39_06150, partial [Silvanigrellaceae bacterium]|nr:hypothetical protein [Silvanigrellaceae bacterium]
DPLWQSFQKPETFSQALEASLNLFQPLLLVSGAHVRSTKTMEKLGESLGLPICVQGNIDASLQSNGSLVAAGDNPFFSQALDFLISSLSPLEKKPQAVIVGTSLSSLAQWLPSIEPTEKAIGMVNHLSEAAQSDLLPTVFMAGFEQSMGGAKKWLFN